MKRIKIIWSVLSIIINCHFTLSFPFVKKYLFEFSYRGLNTIDNRFSYTNFCFFPYVELIFRRFILGKKFRRRFDYAGIGFGWLFIHFSILLIKRL